MRTKEENICLIQALSNANGVSGFEDEVAELGQKETEAYCNVTIDSLRNTYMSLKNNRKQSCKVWIDATQRMKSGISCRRSNPMVL